MTDQHRSILSPDTLTRLSGTMAEFASAWSADVEALRTAEAELATTKVLLGTANMRRDDLQGDLDAALAANKSLMDRNAFLEAQILLIADRAQDAENGMAAVRQRVDATVRADGTVRDRVSAAAAPVAPAVAAPPADRLVKLVRELETPRAAVTDPPIAGAPRQVRELAAGLPDGTDLPQEPPPIIPTPLAPNFFQPAAQ
ncbi:hypothetical protein J4G48_0015220 [Bradyrhizobium barranii subsp. apii]|uniref:hypothetical protein n=1 Tax=Bradyrhizobium barranii TaxID=2992140 RepID=UPI001AA18545|nr:hypothetical protein [Bradyrhizobium barranii]UPT99314.1 hypothetical protein J4G48_0015220 [Bradyrhizobium barranii subsp. apii]